MGFSDATDFGQGNILAIILWKQHTHPALMYPTLFLSNTEKKKVGWQTFSGKYLSLNILLLK